MHYFNRCFEQGLADLRDLLIKSQFSINNADNKMGLPHDQSLNTGNIY